MQDVNQTSERWCSIKEFFVSIGVGRDTLLTWIAEKELPAHKVGCNWGSNPVGSVNELGLERHRCKQ